MTVSTPAPLVQTHNEVVLQRPPKDENQWPFLWLLISAQFFFLFLFFFLNKIPFDEMPSVWLSCRHIIFSPIQNCLTFVDRIFLKLTKILIETELTRFWHLTWISHGRLSIAPVHHFLLHHQSDFVCLVSECNSRESLVCVCLCVCCWVSPGPASIIRLSQNRIKHRHTPD
jgi:hypothetical protein